VKHPPTHRYRFTSAVICTLSVLAIAAPSAEAKTKAKPKAKATKSAAAKGALPALKVIDLTSGKTIDLASLNASTKPQLVWFWAPT
jgi:hypothetical protein